MSQAARKVQLAPAYPTEAHRAAAEAIAQHFSAAGDCQAVLLVNSCARGKATPDSCLDINVLALPDVLAANRTQMEQEWETFYAADDVFKALASTGKFAEVHLDITDGQFTPPHERDHTGGPDGFELGIGNLLAYSVPLWEGGDLYRRLKAEWLPYYGEALRAERLKSVRYFFFNNLDHIPLYVQRGLYFQSFNRLYDAYREFLQALFMAKRLYPIAYDKWIHEQIVDILGLPELYGELVKLFEIAHFESTELVGKGERLRELFIRYVETAG